MLEGAHQLLLRRDGRPLRIAGGDGGWFALALIFVGAAVRVHYAAASYLNPDEAMHVNAASLDSWAAAYAASRNQAHPPLLVLLTHLLPAGSSELVLRTPSILAGVLSLWLAYRWLDVARGRAAALAGLAFLTVSPAMIAMASEVRQGAWLLLFVCAALLQTERFAQRDRRLAVVVFSLCLYGALLSHYSALWVVLAFGIYVPVRLKLAGARRPLWLTWAAFQLPIVLVGYWAYFIHGMSWATGNPAATAPTARASGAARFSYLEPALQLARRESSSQFALRSVHDVWSYLSGSEGAASVLLALFVLATLWSWRGRGTVVSQRYFLLIVLLPFAIGSLAGLSGVYPFAGSRHVAYLLPFAAAAVGLAAATLTREQTPYVMIAAGIAVPLWLWRTVPANDPARMARANLGAAIAYLDSRPADAPILVDFQTWQVLAHYKGVQLGGRAGPLERLRIGERPAFGTQWGTWALTDRNLSWVMHKTVEVAPLNPGQELWVISTAWPHHRPPRKLPHDLQTSVREFGQIWVVRARVPEAASP